MADMKLGKLADQINDFFDGGCDLNDRDSRLSFIAVILSQYNNFDIAEIQNDLSTLKQLMRDAHKSGMLDEEKERNNVVDDLENKINVKIAEIHLNGKTKKELSDEVAGILNEMFKDIDEEEEDD